MRFEAIALILLLTLSAATLVDDTGDGLLIQTTYDESVTVTENIIIPSSLPFWIYPNATANNNQVRSNYLDYVLGQHRYIITAADESGNPSRYDATIDSSDNLAIELVEPSIGGFSDVANFPVEISTSATATCNWAFYAPGKQLRFAAMQSNQNQRQHAIQDFATTYRFRQGESIPIMISCADNSGAENRRIIVVGWNEQSSGVNAQMWPGEVPRQGQELRIDTFAQTPASCTLSENPGAQAIISDPALINRFSGLSSQPEYYILQCLNSHGENIPEIQLPINQNYATSNINVSIEYPLPAVRTQNQVIAVETSLQARCQVNSQEMAAIPSKKLHFAQTTLEVGSNNLSVTCQGVEDGNGTSGEATKTVFVDSQGPRTQLQEDPILCEQSVLLSMSYVGEDAPTHFILTTPEGPILRQWDQDVTEMSIQQATTAQPGEQISIQGIDRAGNIGPETTYDIGTRTREGCEALGITQQILLESPTNGATSADTFSLVVSSELPSTCSYNIGAEEVDFSQTGQTNHIVNNFPEASGLQRNQETQLMVSCVDAANQVTQESFTLAWDLDNPNIQVSADPNPVIDVSDRQTTITVQADQSVICRIDDDAFTPNHELQHTFNRAIPYGSQAITFDVLCENLAGTQVTDSLTVTENYPSQMNIQLRLPSITNQDNLNFNVSTNLQASCQGNIGEQVFDFDTSNGLFHTESLDLNEGSNLVEISCTEEYLQRIATTSGTVILDSTGPQINVTSPPRTCTTSQVLLYGTIQEENDLENFTVEIFDELYDVQEDSGDWSFSLSGLNLTSGQEIPVYIQATDEAGNQGEYLNFEIIARNDGLGACDQTAPDVRLLTEETSQGVNARIVCDDEQSGCNPVFRFGTGPADGQCTFQTRNLNQDHSILLSETSKVCWQVEDNSGNTVQDQEVVEVVDRPNHCFNNEQDADESDVDCGGSCAACQSPDECTDNDDCPSTQICSSSNVCVTPTVNECNTDNDCFPGASCVNNVCQVPAGDQCDGNSDCPLGSICSEGACYEDNEDTNNAACEEDVDCSPGEYCIEDECREPVPPSLECSTTNPCPTGETCFEGNCFEIQTNECSTNADCEAGSICEQNTCVDEVGPTCSENTDCSAGICDAAGHCAVNSCENGVQDGDETATDCGGADCGACEAGEACKVRADCTSKICGPDGTCIQGTCSDGIINNGEGGPDCGGPCTTLCGLDQTCRIGSDCESGFCTNGVCTPTDETGESRAPRPELPGGEPGGDLPTQAEESGILGWIFIIFGLLMALGGGGYIYWEEKHEQPEDSDVDVREDPFATGFTGPTGSAPTQQAPKEDFATTKLREEARTKRQVKKKQNRKDLLDAFESEDEESDEKQQDS